MGLINLEPTLHDGERVLWRRPAALSLPDRLVAGLLLLTSEAVVFMPNRLNRRRYIVSTRLSLGSISHVGTVEPVRSLSARRNGGMRRRLLIAAGDESHLLVINHPERVARELRSALPGSRGRA